MSVSGTQTLVEHTTDPDLDDATDEITMSDNVWKLTWRVSQHRPREFWLGWFLFVVFFTMPAITGYFLGRGYSALADGDTTETIWWAAAIAVSETIRMVAIHHGALIWTKAWIHMQTLLRANMLSAQMASGGIQAGQPVGSAGAAVTHFRDDTEDVANFVDGMVDVSGGVVFTVVAGFVLGDGGSVRGRHPDHPVARRRDRHPHARQPHQGVPDRRSSRDRTGHRPGRRRDGGGAPPSR